MSVCEIAVVVPARNAAGLLEHTLAALAAQDFAGSWELVVVDDASEDETPAVAERAGVRVVRLAHQSGPAGARNAGIAATTAPLIAFTDADCVPVPGWLSAVAAAFARADLVQGPVLPVEEVPIGWFDRTLRLTGPSPRYETANLAVRRSVAEAVGGFEAFAPGPGAPPGLRPRPDQGHFGEDAVFGWRARRQGARPGWAQDARVHHAVFPRGGRGYVAERWRLRFFPALVGEVPELRDGFAQRIFLAPRTRRFDAAVAGAVLVGARRRWWPLALALAAPYVWHHLRSPSPATRSGLAAQAAFVAGDAVGLAALVWGSLAARRLLL